MSNINVKQNEKMYLRHTNLGPQHYQMDRSKTNMSILTASCNFWLVYPGVLLAAV